MLVPVESDENISTLREFRKILQTAIGPRGSCKLLVTGGGYLQLSTGSTMLLNRLELENPLCRYIGQVSAGLSNYGLYFAVMVSHLAEQQWAGRTISKQKLQKTMSSFNQTIQKLLSSDHVCRKVDFSSISCFLPLVKTSLTSKCSTLCIDFDLDKFCKEVVKLFLNCVNDQTNTVGRVYIKAECGPSRVSSHSGLLYQITEDIGLKIIENIDRNNMKILVFTMKLESAEESYLRGVTMLLEKAINSNAKVVACQKTACAEVKLYVARKNVLLLERMGTDLTTELIHMTQAFPISQLDSNILDVAKLLGNLSEIKLLKFIENDYVLLGNNDTTVGTLLVQNNSLAGADHLKILAQQAISALRSLALHPFLTPGGGCLEVWLISQLQLSKETSADIEIIKILSWLQRALLSTCGPSPPRAIDSVYHHGWVEEEEIKCKCGLVSRKELEESCGQLIFLSELISETSRQRLNLPKQPSGSLSTNVLVDCHQQKVNIILSAIETFTNLSDVGLIIYNE